MRGYKISDLDSTTQQLIKDKKLDKNDDGLINEDNGELAELLSQGKVGSIQQLGKMDNRLKNLLMFECIAGGTQAMAIMGNEIASEQAESMARGKEYALRDAFLKENKDFIDRTVDRMANNPKVRKPDVKWYRRKVEEALINNKSLKLEYDDIYHMHVWNEAPPTANQPRFVRPAEPVKVSKFQKFANKISGSKLFKSKVGGKLGVALKVVGGAALLLTHPFTAIPACIGLALYINPNERYEVGMGESDAVAEPKQPQVQPQPQPVVQPTEQEEIKAKFEEGFKELGISEDTELKEYTPQKGEYWISILKAKYGVDDATAQKMANKIKEMVYDDPKASKQTPVMYLPETWTFEGKTYHYNETATVVTTDNYSDDVKTEMGKMSKDLKYE